MRVRNTILFIFLHVTVLLSNGPAHEPLDSASVREVTKLLVEQSFRQNVDHDEISRNWARKFIALLDPKKMRFVASDESDILQLGKHIYEDAQNGDFDFAIDTVERLRKRLDTTSTAIQQLLTSQHDFNLDESMPLTYDEYPVSEDESFERWRKRIKFELLIESHDPRDIGAARDFLGARYDTIHDHYNTLSQANILAIYFEALAKSLDPHACYFDGKTLAMFRTGIVRPVNLGLKTEYSSNDIWIKSIESDLGTINRRLLGKRIVAVAAEGKDTIHITGLTPNAALYILYSPIGDLGIANRVKLEVDDPQSGDRFSVLLNRFPKE